MQAAAESAFAETEAKVRPLRRAVPSRLTPPARLLPQTVAIGQKMDLVFSCMQLAFMFGDTASVKRLIRKARVPPRAPPAASLLSPATQQVKDMLEAPGGGDWERKNRLKVYEGVFAMATRDFGRAATLFLDSLSTFSSTELCSYNSFVFYTVVTSVVALDRVALKQRVVDAPEILAVLGEMPQLQRFLTGLYSCKYGEFMSAFPAVAEQARTDKYLHAHFRYFVREARVTCYSQARTPAARALPSPPHPSPLSSWSRTRA